MINIRTRLLSLESIQAHRGDRARNQEQAVLSKAVGDCLEALRQCNLMDYISHDANRRDLVARINSNELIAGDQRFLDTLPKPALTAINKSPIDFVMMLHDVYEAV